MGKKKMNRRAYALEAAVGAVARGSRSSGADNVDVDADELIAYAKFILGKDPAKKKRRRTKVQGGVRRAYVAKQGTPLPRSLDDLTGGGWKPWDLAVPTVAGATLEKFAEKVRDGDLAADPAPVKAAGGIDLRGIRTRWDAERNVQRGVYPAMPGVRHEDAEVATLDEGKAAGCPECEAELERRGLTDLDTPDPEETSSPVGEDPGDRGILTQWAEAIRQQDAAREAAREARDLEVDPEEKEEVDRIAERNNDYWELSATWVPRRHAPEASEKAPDHVVAQGASLGCPECTTELERREKRDEALEEGRRKLAERLDATAGRLGPLDEDELLAVAGSEVYPPNDKEPSRELTIRNRKGEVRTWKSGGAQEGHGWTASPEDPWGLRYAWTSLEMSRRGPWHVV